ncbi:hypothetical protein HPB51_028404 [Rhipicephalus microplus]|uniref:Uncharacterized protein n=1 Tax=Rhipicephalus microplus TaxID=6941 RepID=A0A9J6CWZ1_RHIMP|nr:hypothetical protein HPB51_028404 [Rhipicephalus microplus]
MHAPPIEMELRLLNKEFALLRSRRKITWEGQEIDPTQVALPMEKWTSHLAKTLHIQKAKTHAALISANTMYNKNGTRLGLSFEMGTLYYKLNETTDSLENRPYHPCERFYLTSIDVVDCIGGLYDIELLPGGMKFGSPFVGPDVVVTWEDEESLKYKMDVDENPPGESLVSENQPNDASSVPSNEEPSNDARAPSAASLDNKNDDDAGLDLTWTGDGWHTVLSRRIKKNHKQSQKKPEKGLENKNEKSAAHPPVDAALDSHVKLELQRRKRRGPTPLPKEDMKVILRLHKGLTVKNLFGSELSMVVIEACRNSFGGESFLLRVHPGSNIIILSTPHEQMAGRLREINQLKIRGRIHPFNAYVADPEDVLRGIVHGLPPGTTQAGLMANLRIRTQGVKIERARMPGSSKSAIITFTGDVLPSCVYFMGAEAICYPYKPTVQVCEICRSTGHRTGVCLTPNANVCSKCGTCDPTQGHECVVNCAICGEEHATGDKSCRKKLKNVAPRKSRVEMPRRQSVPTQRRISRNLSNTSRNLLVGSVQTERKRRSRSGRHLDPDHDQDRDQHQRPRNNETSASLRRPLASQT